MINQQHLQFVQGQLAQFAAQDNFESIIFIAFGDRVDLLQLQDLRQQWLAGDFSVIPEIQVLEHGELGSANGAYAAELDKIFVSADFLATAGERSIEAVLLEEVGHRIDRLLNGDVDSAGDEGEIFSRLVNGADLSFDVLADLKAQDDRGVIVVEGQSIAIEQATYTGTNLDSVLEGVDQILTKIQSTLNSRVFANDLPILGNKLQNSTNTAVQFVQDLKNEVLSQLHSKLDTAKSKTPELVRQALFDALGPGRLNILQDLDANGQVTLNDIQFNDNTDNVDFKLKVKELQASNRLTSAIDSKIGLQKLGLSINGNANIELGYDFDLAFGINKTQGFYLDTTGSNEITIDLKATLPSLNANGNLGALQVTATDKGSAFDTKFKIDIKDNNADDRIYLTDLPAIASENLINATLNGDAKIKINLNTSYQGVEGLPTINSDFNVDWRFDESNANLAAQDAFGKISRVGFDNVNLDLNSFFNNFARPILDKVNTIVEPIQPIIDLLNKTIDLKVAKINLLDILRNFKDENGKPYIDQSDLDFLAAVSQLASLAKSIPNSNEKISLGSFDLGSADIRSSTFDLSKIDPSNIVVALPVSDQLAGKAEGKFISNFDTIPGKGLEFPILTNKKQSAFNLLLGKNVDLFTYDLPRFQFSANYESPFFNIFGPIGGKIKGNIGAGIDLAFGYDTEGVRDFATSKDKKDLFDGFYVSDRANPDGTGEDVKEVTLDLGLNAFGGVGFEGLNGGIGGGVAAKINFDLNDPNDDGKLRFKEFQSLLSNPSDLFCTSGEVTAGLSAYLKVGFGFLSYTKTFDSPRITLLNFNEDCHPERTTTIQLAQPDNGNLRLNIGPNAPARLMLNVVDEAEIFSLQHVSGTAGKEVVAVTASLNKTIDNTNFITTQNFDAGSKIVGNGGEKDDVLEVKSDSPVLIEVAFSGGAGQDLLAGGSGDDLLNGDGGLDQLYGGLGNDSIYGGADDDWLSGEGGADLLDGGDGFDIASYSTSKSGIVVNLATGVNGGDAMGDTLRSIEQITGSAYADVITGDATNNIIEGGAGYDTISGGDGDDILSPGWGDDVVDGGNGTDTLVIDHSTLPTQAVAWVQSVESYYVQVNNAYGIGDPIKTKLSASASFYGFTGPVPNVQISADGTTVAVVGTGGSNSGSDGVWVQKIHDNSSPIKISENTRGNVALSGDGSKIVWIGSNSPSVDRSVSKTYEIFIANTDGTQVIQLTNDDVPASSVTISADGSTIAWGSLAAPSLSNRDIFIANSDGSNIRKITSNATNRVPHIDSDSLSPSLSADGSKIAWKGATNSNGENSNSVWVANVDGTELRNVAESLPIYSIASGPSISSDGLKVIWSTFDTSYNHTDENQIYVANTDGSHLSTITSVTTGEKDFEKYVYSDGQRVVFYGSSKPSEYSLYTTSVDGTEPLTLINAAAGSYYRFNSPGPVLSSYVDKGVIYNSFDSVTGSGEIYTWGPSRVRYSNIERFDIIGTRYGDELRGGNLDDRLVGGGGADILKGFLGNDTYGFNIANSAGSQIEDTGGNDTLELKTTTTESNGIQKDNSVELSLSSPSNGIFGLKRDGSNLIIDINKDGIATAKTDLSIIDFFNATGTAAGIGFIEKIENLSGTDILNKFKAIEANIPPTQLSINNNQIVENSPVKTVVGILSATSSTGDTLTYRLINGEGDADNLLFEIVDNTVRAVVSPDFEIKNNYTVRIKATNQNGLSTEKAFSINVTNINEAPTQITIDNLQIPENSPVNTLVGNLSAIDPDTGDALTYSILPTNDYQSFTIIGNQLQLATVPDFKTKSSYQLQLQATDQAGLSIDKSFTISVTDLPEISIPPVTPKLTINSNQTLQINGIPGIKHLSFQFNNQGQQNFSETALFKVDDSLGSINGKKPGEAGYIEAALDRFQVISSSLATNSIPQGFNGNTSRSIDLNSGDLVRLAAINNGSIDQLRLSQIPLSQIIFSDPTTTKFTETNPGEITLNWQGAINLSLTAKLNSEITLGTNTQNSPQGEMIDFRQSTTDINATFSIYREAAYNNSVYIYAVQDEAGTIIDDITQKTLKPTDADYIQTAIRNSLKDVNLNTANQSVTTSTTILSKGNLFAPIIVINGDKNAFLDNNSNNVPAAYTPFVLGNADKVDHIRLLGDNTFGFEDLPGGGDMDYNDIIVKMSFKPII